MQPTFKLRWLVLQNQVTREMIDAERERSDDPLLVCRDRLLDRTEPVLQQWHDAEPSDGLELCKAGGAWKTVDLVIERHAQVMQPVVDSSCDHVRPRG